MNLFSWIIRLICLFSNLRQLICLITQRKSIGTVIPLLQLQFDKIREGQRLSLFLPDEGDRAPVALFKAVEISKLYTRVF